MSYKLHNHVWSDFQYTATYELSCAGRCMACDRPLAKLDPDMGGFVPGPHMPISVSLEPSKNNGVVLSSKEGPGQGRSGTSRKGPPAQHSRTALHAQQPQTGQKKRCVCSLA
jgi:hypothetical protein